MGRACLLDTKLSFAILPLAILRDLLEQRAAPELEDEIMTVMPPSLIACSGPIILSRPVVVQGIDRLIGNHELVMR